MWLNNFSYVYWPCEYHLFKFPHLYLFLLLVVFFWGGGGKILCVCVCVLDSQLCPTLCDPIDWSLPGSSVHGIAWARIPEWVASPFSREYSQPKNQTWDSCITGGFFTVWVTRETPFYVYVLIIKHFSITYVANNFSNCAVCLFIL